MGFAYGLGRFLKNAILVLWVGLPFSFFFFLIYRGAWKLVDSQVHWARVSPMVYPSRQFRQIPRFAKRAGD